MWGKLQLFGVVFGFLLYFVDLGSDFYVFIQHVNNGDGLFAILTISCILFSIFLVNIFAASVLKSKLAVACGCFFHVAMISLFVNEIGRWKNENIGKPARPCDSGKHFSKCECSTCLERVKESTKAFVEIAHVRSIETFCESVPQWLLQVYVMIYKQSYPRYAILSVLLSFLSLVYSIYSLERNYWNRKIVNSMTDYLRPVSFPKRSAVVFVIWQALLLSGRLSAIVFMLAVIDGNVTGSVIFWHWLIVVVALVSTVSSSDGWCEFLWKVFLMSILSFFIIYPLLFHVSDSSVACLKKFIPKTDRISARFKCVAAIMVPLPYGNSTKVFL